MEKFNEAVWTTGSVKIDKLAAQKQDLGDFSSGFHIDSVPVFQGDGTLCDSDCCSNNGGARLGSQIKPLQLHDCWM